MKRKTNMRLRWLLAATAIGVATANAADKAGIITAHSQGLHGYIGFGHEKLPAQGGYNAKSKIPTPHLDKLTVSGARRTNHCTIEKHHNHET